MKRLVVLSGAGISKESGIPTFRDNDGLWKTHRFEDVASPEAWQRNPDLVMEFYNFRRKTVIETQPNKAHLLLADLQKQFDVQIITQNVDDLHERAGSKNILHLHGEIRKARSINDENFIIDIKGAELNIGNLCPNGSQLRPHIVWFGEAVPNIPKAIEIIKTADIFLVVGTGLQVYPAAGLIDYVDNNAKKFIIDPNDNFNIKDFYHFKENAVAGMQQFYYYIIN
ncbi:MAG: NAD-dependent deacylase [Bacteroidales bacterium]|nr:NAD-dependent deacylase [Bacteroidales bacterium]